MKDQETCQVICEEGEGEPVGEFYCIMQQVQGESVCCAEGITCKDEINIAGSFEMVVLLPAGMSPHSDQLAKVVKEVLSQVTDVLVTDFKVFRVASKSVEDPPPMRRMRRRLAARQAIVTIIYDLSGLQPEKVEKVIKNMQILGDDPNSAVTASFLWGLLYHSIRVLKIDNMQVPTRYRGIALVGTSEQTATEAPNAPVVQSQGISGITIGIILCVVGIMVLTFVVHMVCLRSKGKEAQHAADGQPSPRKSDRRTRARTRAYSDME